MFHPSFEPPLLFRPLKIGAFPGYRADPCHVYLTMGPNLGEIRRNFPPLSLFTLNFAEEHAAWRGFRGDLVGNWRWMDPILGCPRKLVNG